MFQTTNQMYMFVSKHGLLEKSSCNDDVANFKTRLARDFPVDSHL